VTLVGNFIKAAETNVKREVLEFVRLCVSISLGGKINVVKEVSLNNGVSKVFFEEECFVIDNMLRRPYFKRIFFWSRSQE